LSQQSVIERASSNRRPFRSFFRAVFSGLLDFIYPPICPLCNGSIDHDGPLCSECLTSLFRDVQFISHNSKSDFKYLKGKIGFDNVLFCWAFTPEIETLIHMVKYQRGRKLGKTLGRIMGEQIREHVPDFSRRVFVPVPLHPVRRRERGYNQSEVLCRGVAEIVPITINARVLIRKKHTQTQTLLSAGARQENVRDAFLIRDGKSIENRRVVLVDDVVTTGATMQQCAKMLTQAGAASVTGLALARPVIDL
jgi:competence protein ComFC